MRTIILGVTILGLAGCISPEQYETEPVSLKTAKGTVVCQLYTKEQVVWDRAIDWPRKMTVEEADNICKAEGYRQLREG